MKKNNEINNHSMPLFRVWMERSRNLFNDKKNNTLDTAEILSRTLFNKEYNDLLTYEHKLRCTEDY